MKIIAVTCMLSFYFVSMHCVKRGSPPLLSPPEKYRIVLDSNEYYQSDEPHTDDPTNVEHDTEPSAHAIESHVPGPENPIQQYVNPWGGPYYPPNYSNMPIPWNPYGQSPYGPIAFAPVQTEYGVLVPDVPPPPPPPSSSSPSHHHHDSVVLTPHHPSAYTTDLFELLKDLVPRNLVFLLAKSSAFIVSVFSFVAFSGIITYLICTFTPICTISFAAFTKADFIKSIATKQIENGNDSIDRVRRAVQFVSSAIEKYDKLQQTATARKLENV